MIKINLDKSNSNNITFHKIFKIIDYRKSYNGQYCVKNINKGYDTLKIVLHTISFNYE